MLKGKVHKYGAGELKGAKPLLILPLEGPTLPRSPAKAPPEFLICFPALQIPFSSHSLCSVTEAFMMNQFPRAASASPTTFVFLMLVHTFPKVRGEANVEPTFGIPQDIDKIQDCPHDR